MRDLVALAPPVDERLVEPAVVARRLGLALDDPAAELVADAASALLQGPEGSGRPLGFQPWEQRSTVVNLPTPAVVLHARPVSRIERLEVDGEPLDASAIRLGEGGLLFLDEGEPGQRVRVEYWGGWWLPTWDEPGVLDPVPPRLPRDLVLAARVLAEHLHEGARLDGVVEESFWSQIGTSRGPEPKSASFSGRISDEING